MIPESRSPESFPPPPLPLYLSQYCIELQPVLQPLDFTYSFHPPTDPSVGYPNLSKKFPGRLF